MLSARSALALRRIPRFYSLGTTAIPRSLSSAADLPIGGGYMQTGHVLTNSGATRVLVTGAMGQIGSELIPLLRERYGAENVIASDIKNPHHRSQLVSGGPFVYLDVMNMDNFAAVALENRIDIVIHMATLLSAVGEMNPQLAMKLNTRGIENVLELARLNDMRVYAPSTIAVFGPTTPKKNTPDLTVCRPTTIYGITKVYVELLGEYYHNKYGVDFRSLRYPGIISPTLPGGGTTDYAVEIYHEALKHGRYKCFLRDDAKMPMMYMPDCLKATVDIIDAPPESLTQRVYNVTGVSFTPKQLAAAIKKRMPHFDVEYIPDFRQVIADSWPRSIDDSNARADWAWKPEFDIESMTDDMLSKLADLYREKDRQEQ